MYERETGHTQESDWRKMRPKNLTKFSELEGWKVGEEHPDVRSWSLLDETDEEIGTITDYLVDTDAGEVIFLVVNYDNRTTMVPLDQVELNEDDKTSTFRITPDHLTSAPLFTGDVSDLDVFYDYWVGMGPIKGMPYEEEKGRVVVLRWQTVRIMRV